MAPNHSATEIDCPVQLKATQNHLLALPSHLSLTEKCFETHETQVFGGSEDENIKETRAFFSAFEASFKQQPLRNILSLICFSVHNNLPLQMWYIFQRLNKSEFKPGTEVKKQGPEAKGTKEHKDQQSTPQKQPQYDTNPR